MMISVKKDKLIEFCQDIIRIPSLTGQEKAVADKIAAEMKRLGYADVIVDEFGSVIGKIQGQSGRPVIIFDGHMDTVPVTVPAAWTHDPYGAEIEDGRIYGRGATDMKGPIAAMVYGLASLLPVKKQLKGTIYLSCSVYEERIEGVCLGKVIDRFPADYVFIGEPSNLDLMIGQKGRAEIIVKTMGKNAHTSTPHLGINAVYETIPIIKGLKNIRLPRDESLGDAVLELTDIISGPYPGTSMVPDSCRVTYDRRLLAGETRQAVLESIKKVIDESMKEDRELKATAEYYQGQGVCYTGATIAADGYIPAWLMPKDSILVRKAFSGLTSVSPQSKISTWAFCTNGSESAGNRNIPTVGFGPGSAQQAHINDEYIEIAQLLKASEGYAAIARTVLT